MGFTASNLLVAIDAYGDTRMWDHKTAGEVSVVLPTLDGNGVLATLTLDGRWIAFSVKGMIEVRAVSDGGTLVASIAAPAPILHMAFSPNGNVLALVTSDGEVFRWRFGKNVTLEPIGRRSGASVSGLAVDNDGRRIFWALGGQTNVYQKPRPQPENGTLHFFDFDTKTEQVVEKLSPVSFLIVSPDGRSLAATHASKEVSLWPLHSNTPAAFSNPARVLKGHSDRLFTARFSPDSSMLAAASEDQGVMLWRVETGELLRVLKGHLEAVIQIAFNQEGDLLAAADTECRVKVWNLKSPLQPLAIRGAFGTR